MRRRVNLPRLALCAVSALSLSFCGAPAFAHREPGTSESREPGQCPPIKGRAAMKIPASTPTASSRKAMMKVGVAE